MYIYRYILKKERKIIDNDSFIVRIVAFEILVIIYSFIISLFVYILIVVLQNSNYYNS